MSGTKKPTLCDKGSLRNTDTLQTAPSGKVILRSRAGSKNTDRPSCTAIGDNLATRRNPWLENTNWRRQAARNRTKSPCIVSNPLRCCDFTRLGTNDPLRTRESVLLVCLATTLAKCFLHEVNDVTGNRSEQKFIISAHQRSKRFNLHLYLADHKLTPLFACTPCVRYLKILCKLAKTTWLGNLVDSRFNTAREAVIPAEFGLLNGNALGKYQILTEVN